MPSPPRVLITGGEGFLGRHLADALEARGGTVRTFDDASSEGARGRPRRDRWVLGDVRDLSRLEAAAKGMDALVHLAARAVIPDDPMEGYSVNVLGTLNALRAACSQRVPRVVLASSSSVYGNAGAPPFSEGRSPGPVGLRGASYGARELLGRAFAEREGLTVIALRLFHVYGRGRARSHHPGILTAFGEALARGEPPGVPGTGEATRDFLSVQDAVAAFTRALDRRLGRWTVVNVGTGVPVSLRAAAEMACEAMGRLDLEPVSLAPGPEPATSSFADLRTARSVLGFEPAVGLAEGLAKRDWFLP